MQLAYVSERQVVGHGEAVRQRATVSTELVFILREGD